MRLRMPRRRTLIIIGSILLVLAGACGVVSWRRVRQRAELQRQWVLVEVGMTEQEVKALLGEPGRMVISGGHGGPYWYYGKTRHYALRRRPSFPYVAIEVSQNYDGMVSFGNRSYVHFNDGRSPHVDHVKEKSELGHETYHLGS